MSVIVFLLLISSWEVQTSGVTVNLQDVDCVSASECWAVGASGTILHTADVGSTWTQQTSGTTAGLYGVDFVDTMNGWAVGAGPIILHTSDGGTSWNAQSAGTSNDLVGVTFVNTNRGWAVGPSGTIVGTTDGGASWNSEISGEWTWFNSVTAASPSAAWTIGSNWFTQTGPIFYYNGSSWSNQFEITATQDGKGISCVDVSTVWAAGGNGAIAHTTNGGTNWTSQTSGTSEMLLDVSAVSQSSCWIVGANGAILYTSNAGNEWLQDSCPVSDTLFAVTMLDTLNGWVVGENGVILHTSGGVGIEESSDFPTRPPISIFPNPVTSELQVLFEDFPQAKLTIQLFDVSGRLCSLLYTGIPNKELKFQLSNLPSGAYFLIISTPNKRIPIWFLKISY